MIDDAAADGQAMVLFDRDIRDGYGDADDDDEEEEETMLTDGTVERSTNRRMIRLASILFAQLILPHGVVVSTLQCDHFLYSPYIVLCIYCTHSTSLRLY